MSLGHLSDDQILELDAMTHAVERGSLSRRGFLQRAMLLGVACTTGTSLLAACSSASSTGGPSASTGGAQTLGQMFPLLYGAAYHQDPEYKGTNQGGTIGEINLGTFPTGKLPFLGVRAKKQWVIADTILTSIYPLPVAFAERARLDSMCLGVKVLKYDFELKPELGVQNAHLMVQQGVNFAIILNAFTDVNEQISRILDAAGIQQLYYAIPPATAHKPFMELPDYSTGVRIGAYLAQYAKDNWNGQLDMLLRMSQKTQGPTSDYRMDGFQTGVESVLGKTPANKVVTVDSGAGTVESSRDAVAAILPKYPGAKYILGCGVADEISVGGVRALEAAGKADFAALGGQPGTPEGIDELKKGSGKSAFKLSILQDLAEASWPVALGIYALQGGKLPDVSLFKGLLVTADGSQQTTKVTDIPPQVNDGYNPTCS